MKFDLRALSALLHLVGFLHCLEHVGVTGLGKVRAKISEFVDLAMRDPPKRRRVLCGLPLPPSTTQRIDGRRWRNPRSRRSCNIAVHTQEFSVDAQPYAQRAPSSHLL